MRTVLVDSRCIARMYTLPHRVTAPKNGQQRFLPGIAGTAKLEKHVKKMLLLVANLSVDSVAEVWVGDKGGVG